MTLAELRNALELLPESAGKAPVVMGDNMRNTLGNVVMSIDPINGTTIRLYGNRTTEPARGEKP